MPPRTFVPRPRLERDLTVAVTKPVTVLIAPAGSGKTATLAGWAMHADHDVLWMAVRDQEPSSRLAEGLMTAAGVAPSEGDPPAGPDAVVEALGRSTAGPSILVVDDAHRLSPATWQLLDAVLTQVPDRVHVVLATRRDAPLSLVALELAQALTVLRADAFRFDDEEAIHLVAAHSPDVSKADLQELLNRAGGWAAAIVLGARRLGGAVAGDRTAVRGALARTEQPVLDYLLGDVFATIPASTRHVLLCTAGEQEITGEAAVILSADLHAADHLADLAADGMLVTSYEQGSSLIWQYHPLLQELLRRQVASDGPDHELAIAAHARAAQYYALHGPAPLALRHAVAARDETLLTRLLLERGVTLMNSGHDDLLLGALGALPHDAADTTPALHGIRGLLLRSFGDLEEAMREAALASRAARKVLAELETSQRPPSSVELAMLADSATLNAWLARFGWHDVDDAVTAARLVLGERVGRVPSPTGGAVPRPLEPARLAWLLHELAIVETWRGSLEDAALHVDEALLIARTVGLHCLAAAALADRAVLQLLHGQFQTAADSGRDCLAAAALADSSGDRHMGRPHVALGWAAFYDLRLDDAELALSSVRTGKQGATDPLVAMLALVLAARLKAERGDVTAARRMLASPPPHPKPVPPYLRGIFAVVRAHWAMVAGDLVEVQRQLLILDELDWAVSSGAFRAVVTHLGGDAEAACGQLEVVLDLPAEGEQIVCSVFAAAYLARLYLNSGRDAAARVALREALTRAAPQQLLHPILTSAAGGPAYPALLAELAAGPGKHPFAATALDAAKKYRRLYPDLSGGAAIATRQGRTVTGRPRPGWPEDPGSAHAAPLPLQSLTGRETEVLCEMALGGSYADIAHTLFVSENTVKTHVSSLYRKLGVERRADALRRARQLELL